MAIVQMSNVAYEDFLKLLKENNIDSNIIRIYVAGMGCSGPAFNLVLDEQNENDIVEQINDIKFLVEKDLVTQYGGFILKSGSENGRGGFSIETEIKPESSCGGGCAGCH
jgi:HesB-like selenoprotein